MVEKKLKHLRQQCGMTQRQLADELGISSSAVGMYEQGRREPDYKTLLAICRLFGTSADYLLREEDGNQANNKEFATIIKGFERTLLEQEGLMFNGVLLEKNEVEKVVNAMKIGIELALNHKN
ncbi:MAG: helix-turn-helix domain-containing protein [Oscillospiraceae bacterium]|jgi:transcriptional regulator with XRE-family HTH domain|nr:helix-turn-helix domain-containing protein [Oscillospiraceae bacterium]